MAYINIDGTASPAFILKTALRLFGQADRTAEGAETDQPVTEERTLRAIAGLSDEQLDDIGIRRKARLVRSDYLSRTPCPPPILKFDYFRAGG